MDINAEKIDMNCLKESKVFLYTPLAHERDYPIYKTINQLLELARVNNVLIAYDPNFRFPYRTEEEHQSVVDAIRTSDILKLTIEEMSIILGEHDVIKGIEKLLGGNVKLAAVTMGKYGCFLGNRNGLVYRPTFNIPGQDTTGTGDSFMGTLLYSITCEDIKIDCLNQKDLERIADFCNACASGCTMHRGSLLVMPNKEQAEKFMCEIPRIHQTGESPLGFFKEWKM